MSIDTELPCFPNEWALLRYENYLPYPILYDIVISVITGQLKLTLKFTFTFNCPPTGCPIPKITNKSKQKGVHQGLYVDLDKKGKKYSGNTRKFN